MIISTQTIHANLQAANLPTEFQQGRRIDKRGGNQTAEEDMAMLSNATLCRKIPQIICKRKDKDKDPYKVIEITPPPQSLGIRCFPPNLQCGETVTIEGRAYTISSVTHRYQLRKGKYEPSEKRLDVLSTGRYILNLYLENLLENS